MHKLKERDGRGVMTFLRPLIPAAAAAASIAALASGSVPKYSARQFYETIAITGASFSHDESRILFASDASGVFNLYTVPVTGGEPTQLTFSKDNAITSGIFFPQDNRVIYLSDQGGNELHHAYVLGEDGSVKDVTPGEKLKAVGLGWSGDDKSFYMLTNERDAQFFDVYKYDAKTLQRTMVFKNELGVFPGDVSRDGRWIALEKINDNADSDIFLFDVKNPTAEPRLVTPRTSDEPISHGSQTFTPDSSTLLFTSNADSEFDHLRAYVIAGVPEGQKNHQVIEKYDWDIMYCSYSKNGQYKVVATNEDARTVIRVTDVKSNKQVSLPGIPRGDVTGVTISPSGRYMAFYVNGDTSPSNLFVHDFKSGSTKQLTNSLNPAMKPEHLAESKVIRYKSFDGLDIPAVLYKPLSASASNKVPALVWVHGGPGGQSRTGYSAMIQFLVNHDYAILAVNNRGSSGYGKTFFHLDDRKHGEDDLQDCVYGRKYLESLDWVDDDRIGIIGGSYGGFMVAAALTFTPEAFDVGINIFGVTNWVRTLESIPAWWAAQRERLYAELGDPAEDKERLTRISPLFHAKNIVRPMMVIQGANDPRVLKIESDEIVAAAQANGVPVEYVVFPDEGHGFLNKENRITASESQLQFLDRYLKGKQ